jgi:hypothetical protein
VTRATTSSSFRYLVATGVIAVVAAFAGLAAFGALSATGGTGAVTAGCSSTDSSCNFTFNFKNAAGAPECRVAVNFTVSGVTGASVSPKQGTTDCNGNVLAAFSAGTTGCGTATITASTSDATTQSTVTVPCDKGELPNTSTVPPTTLNWWAGLSVLAALVVAGGGFAIRRMRAAS